jgi:hypothetical protein
LLFLLLSSLIIVSWHAAGVSPEAAAQEEPNRSPPAPPPLSIQGRRWWPRKEASNLGPIWLRPKMESRILGRRPAPNLGGKLGAAKRQRRRQSRRGSHTAESNRGGARLAPGGGCWQCGCYEGRSTYARLGWAEGRAPHRSLVLNR